MSTKNTAAKKDYSVIMKIVAIVVALIVIALTVFNFVSGKGVLLRSKTAAKSDNFKVTGTEMAYYSGMAFQQFYGENGYLFSYLGLDTTKSLKSQPCPILEDGTWFDYFMQSSKSSVTELLALAEYAKANGIELDAEDLKVVEDNIDSMKADAAQNNRTLDSYLSAVFQNGLNEKDARGALELSVLASKASEKFIDGVDVSGSAMDAYYAEHPEEFDGVDFYTYTLDLSAEQEAADEAEGEDGEEMTAVDGTASLAFIAGMTTVNSVDSYKALIYNYEAALDPEADEDALNEKVEATLQSHILKSAIGDEDMAEWLFSAKVGETYIPEGETGVYTIAVLAKEAYREDTLNRAVRHILIDADDESEDDEALAEDILAQLKAADFSEEKWNELAAANSTDPGSKDNGGLYDSIVAGQTYTEFNDWLFDENRAEGDSAVVDTDAGHHIMYYVGESDTAAWMTTAEAAIKNAGYAAMIEEYAEGIEFNDSVLDSIVLN